MNDNINKQDNNNNDKYILFEDEKLNISNIKIKETNLNSNKTNNEHLVNNNSNNYCSNNDIKNNELNKGNKDNNNENKVDNLNNNITQNLSKEKSLDSSCNGLGDDTDLHEKINIPLDISPQIKRKDLTMLNNSNNKTNNSNSKDNINNNISSMSNNKNDINAIINQTHDIPQNILKYKNKQLNNSKNQ